MLLDQRVLQLALVCTLLMPLFIELIVIPSLNFAS